MGTEDLYVKSIRNTAKRAYAEAYLAWLRGGEIGDPPDYGKLSYMAAQAVRLQLRNVVECMAQLDKVVVGGKTH